MGKCKRTRREKNLKKDEVTGEWIVYKSFKKIGYHEYGRYRTFREAKKQRKYLDENDNWINELPDSKKLKLKKGNHKGYVKSGSSFLVTKTVNHIQSYYGQYQTVDDAEKVVDALIKYNYNWDEIPMEIKDLQLTENVNPSFFPGARFKLIKKTTGKVINMGYYASKKDALKVKSWLDNHDWNVEQLPVELKDLQLKLNSPKFYSYNKDRKKYIIHKNYGGKLYTYGAFDTEEEAKNAVRILKENKWSKNCLIKLNLIPPKKHKYYTFNKRNNRYYIFKTVNGKKEFFGSYRTEKKAQEVVELLKKNNWDKNCLNGIKWEPKYCSYNKLTGKYQVEKIINGKSQHFGSYNSKKEAQEIVELLKEHNWDKSILKKLNILRDKPENKYYTFDKKTGKYRIQRTINGKNYRFGVYNTKQEAIKAIELLKQNNWNKECLNHA